MALKHNSRRQQIIQAGSTMFIALAIASVVVAFSAVCIRFLLQKKSYNDRVITAKTTARDDIKTNTTNVSKLSEQFPVLDSSTTTNAKKILNALPPTYDYAALATSVEYLASQAGVQLVGAVGQDGSSGSPKTATMPTPQEIPLSIEVRGNYVGIKTFIENLEKSTRPINVKSVDYSGSNNTLRAIVQGVTYYQPAQSFDAELKAIQ